MPQPVNVVLDPRKSPVQARAAASVDAILEATVQVLLSAGKERLSTTRVASRAGVSVGTLYQYFPNKSALLQAALRRHLEEVTRATEEICRQQHGRTLREMATALVSAFFAAKMRRAATSVALYMVSSDVDAASVVREMGARSNAAIVRMLQSSCEPLTKPAGVVALLLQGTMAGVSRRLLESDDPEGLLESVRSEMVLLTCTYLEAASKREACECKVERETGIEPATFSLGS